MIVDKGITNFRAIVMAGALLAVLLGAPRRLAAQTVGSGLESTESVTIGGIGNVDTLWADNVLFYGISGPVYHRWFMNNDNVSGNLPVAAWACYAAANSGCIVVGASGAAPPYAEYGLINSGLAGAFLQQQSSVLHPTWSAYALPATLAAGGEVLNSTSAMAAGFTPTITLGVAGTTLGSVTMANTVSGTVTLQPVSAVALGSGTTVSIPPVTGTLAETSDTVNYSTGTYQYASNTAVMPANGEFTGITGSALVTSGNEAEVEAPVARAGTAVEMVLFTQGTITSTNTVTITLRINGTTESGTACTISMSSNPTTCTFSQSWSTGSKLDYLVGVSGTAPMGVYFISLAYN